MLTVTVCARSDSLLHLQNIPSSIHIKNWIQQAKEEEESQASNVDVHKLQAVLFTFLQVKGSLLTHPNPRIQTIFVVLFFVRAQRRLPPNADPIT
jgi:hypothetical protein